MCLCQRGKTRRLPPRPSLVHPAAVAAAWSRSGMLSAGTKKCNWRNFPSSFGEPFQPRKAIERGAVRSTCCCGGRG